MSDRRVKIDIAPVVPIDPRPFWAYPSSAATKAHWFSAVGSPSGCRRYIAQMPALMTVLEAAPAEVYRCAACERAEAKASAQPVS